MIKEAKRRLSFIFLSIIVLLSGLVLIVVYSFVYFQLIGAVEEHMANRAEVEFMAHYKKNEFDLLRKIIHEERFQVLDRQGKVVLEVKSSIQYQPQLNRSSLATAFSGGQVFETIMQLDANYIVLYTPLDNEHVLRVTGSFNELSIFQRIFFIVSAFSFPIMLIISYYLSRYMVSQALKPVMMVLEYQETYSSNITHELNTPLTSIKGNIEVLLRRERPVEEYRETLKFVLRRIDRIIDLLNNLCLLATSKFRSLELYWKKVGIMNIIEDVIEKHEPSIYAKKIKVYLPDGERITCICDETLMQRVFANLIDNAVKYTPCNGLIKIEARHDSDNCMFTISNTCKNIKKDEIKNFFTPFYLGNNALDTGLEGKGLGLYIVRYIIHLHGGTISADIEKEMLIFTIEIPRGKCDISN